MSNLAPLTHKLFLMALTARFGREPNWQEHDTHSLKCEIIFVPSEDLTEREKFSRAVAEIQQWICNDDLGDDFRFSCEFGSFRYPLMHRTTKVLCARIVIEASAYQAPRLVSSR